MRRRSRMKTLKILRLFAQGRIVVFMILVFCSLILGEPGYLDFDNLPETNFTCAGKVIGGYYADLETSCQMFHVCTIGQLEEPMDIKFLCLNGTVFDQETRVCERVDEVDCTKSERFYYLNLELYGNTMVPIPEEESSTKPSTTSTTTTTTSTTTTSTTTRRPSTTVSTIPTPVIRMAIPLKKLSIISVKTTSSPTHYVTTTGKSYNADITDEDEYDYEEDYLTTDGKELQNYREPESDGNHDSLAQQVFSPEQFIFRQNNGKSQKHTVKPAISFQQQQFQNGGSLTVTNSHVTVTTHTSEGQTSNINNPNNINVNKQFSSKPKETIGYSSSSTTKKPQFSFYIAPPQPTPTPKRIPLLPQTSQQGPPSGHPGLSQIPPFRLPAQGFRLPSQQQEHDLQQHLLQQQQQLDEQQKQRHLVQQQQEKEQQKQQEQQEQRQQEQEKQQQLEQQKQQEHLDHQQLLNQQLIDQNQPKPSPFEGYRRHTPQISLRLPIENEQNAQNPHQELLGFENAHDDFPLQEHKDLKRSDPHATSTTISTTNSTRQSSHPTYPNHHHNHKPYHSDELQKPQPFNTRIETSSQNSNYDKVLLTLQDQYIPTLPKVIITASASVSDASGKKLNYSVGNVIGTNVKIPPLTYDEYKEDDVVLDPFFLDVPKIKPRRHIRDVNSRDRSINAVRKKRKKIVDKLN